MPNFNDPLNIAATALETIVQDKKHEEIHHSELIEASLQLCEVLSQEFILCPPCQRIQDLVEETLDEMVLQELITRIEVGLHHCFPKWCKWTPQGRIQLAGGPSARKKIIYDLI